MVEADFASLEGIISPLRIGVYLNEVGHDQPRALRLYLWNVRMGEVFHLPIQSVEVAVRNRVNHALCTIYSPDWWQEPAFLTTAEERRADDIEAVRRRVKHTGKRITTDRIVGGLSFGFWVALLGSHYNIAVWSRQLRTSFPSLPAGINRKSLHDDLEKVAELRNRIWHHEPIFKRDLTQDYSRCMRVLHWVSPEKAAWIRPHCRVMDMLRERP